MRRRKRRSPAQKVMGAVFPPAPTFPCLIRLPVKAIFLAWADQDRTKVSRPSSSPSGFQPGISASSVPTEASSRYFYPVETSFAGPSPESSGSAGRLGKWERPGLRLASRFFLARPAVCSASRSFRRGPWHRVRRHPFCSFPLRVPHCWVQMESATLDRVGQSKSTCG